MESVPQESGQTLDGDISMAIVAPKGIPSFTWSFFPFSFLELIYYDHGSTFMGEKCLCTLNDLESAKHGSTFFKSVIMYENWPFKKTGEKNLLNWFLEQARI